MGTKLDELRDGCFARAKDDEPMFVLLGRDRQAPTLVRQWAENRKAEIELGRKPASDMPMVTEAFQCADNMEAWREANDGSWRIGGLFADAAMAATGKHGVHNDEEMQQAMNERRTK